MGRVPVVASENIFCFVLIVLLVCQPACLGSPLPFQKPYRQNIEIYNLRILCFIAH